MKKLSLLFIIIFMASSFAACNSTQKDIENRTEELKAYYTQEADIAKWRIDRIGYERIKAIKSNTTGEKTFPDIPHDVEIAKRQIIELVTNKNYREATIVFHSNDYNSEEFNTLQYYAFALWSDSENDYYNRNNTIQYFLNPEYEGELNTQIKDFSLKYADIGTNAEDKSSYIISNEKTKEDKKEYLKIGLTKFQVYNSDWGSSG